MQNKGFGPLVLTQRVFVNEGKASAMFGRMIGLYDYVMDFRTDLDRLDDMTARLNYFRTISIWIDESPRRVKNAWASICSDYPGKGKADVADPSVTPESIRKWRDLEMYLLFAADEFWKTAFPLWGWDNRRVADDLGFPQKEFGLVFRWSALIGDDVIKCSRHAKRCVKTLSGSESALKASRETFNESYSRPFREEYIRAWKEMEDILVSLPKQRRKEVTA